MTTTITIDQETAAWLKKHLQGGWLKRSRKNWPYRELLIEQIQNPTSGVTLKQERKTRTDLGGVRYGSASYEILDLFLYSWSAHGLTNSEAASRIRLKRLDVQAATVVTACSAMKRKGLLRVDGRREGLFIYHITAKGRRALSAAKEAKASESV